MRQEPKQQRRPTGQEHNMLDLIEHTNREMLYLMGLSMAMGILIGVMAMEPWVTRLQSRLRNIARPQ